MRINLSAARRHRGVRQQQLATMLGVSQSNVSQLERAADLKLSTLDGYVAALGGRLEVRAVFDDDEVVVVGPEPRARVGAAGP